MRLSALLIALHAIASAQPVTTTAGQMAPGGANPATAAAPTKPEDLCTISGQVLNGVTGEPLRRANIVFMRADPTPGEMGPPTTYTTSSNANGEFAMKDVEPGKYRLTANRNGYVPLVYGARGPQRPGTTISLVRQQRMADLTLKLTPHAVLIGRILDEEGEPVVNARIMLQSYRYIQGRKQLTMAGGGAGTNDLGEYRIFGVSPGKYYLSATPVSMSPGFAIDRSGNAGPDEDYVATFYPGTIDPASATQIDVAAGAQLRGLDVVLSKTRTVHVKGRVVHGMAGRQNLQVMLTPRNPGGFMGMMRGTPVDAAGNFDIRNVTPGAYMLTATLNDGATTRQGRLPVDVGGSTVEGLNITIAPGVSVKGRVRPDGDSAPVDLSTVRLALQPREQNLFGGGGQAKADQDGVFEIKNVSPDRYNLFASGLPAGAYVKSARTDDVDILASGLDISGRAPGMIEVVISPRAATVTGTVQNAKTGNAAPGAMVVLIPQERERREQQTYYKTITSDQHGAFAFTGVTPGEYKIYAWEDIEMGAYMDPDFLKPVEGKGETVTLREGDQKAVSLKMISAESPGAAN